MSLPGGRVMKLPLLASVVVAVFLTEVISMSSSQFVCNPKDCTCDTRVKSRYVVRCTKSGASLSPVSTLTVNFQPKTSVSFVCTTSSVDYDWLTGIQFGEAPLVSFINCPLTNNSIHELLTSLGITNTTSVTFQSMKNISTKLKTHHFKGLSNLTTLVLSLNELNTLPEDIFSGMGNLTKLDLSNSGIQLDKNVFKHTPNLRRLEMGMNNLAFIEPGVFQHLIKLQILNLWRNKLHNLTKETFIGLSSLTALDLSGNGITSLKADVFEQLRRLNTLSLSNNTLTSLPQTLIREIPLLEKLMLSNLQYLTVIPGGLLANLTELKEVYLNNCNISQLPEDLFWGSDNILLLDISNNNIRKLPEHIFKDSKHLTELDIRHNKLEALPEKLLSSVKKLHILRLGHNILTVIPRDLFGALSELKLLDLQHNALYDIHGTAFRNNNNLKWLYMKNNHISFENNTFQLITPLGSRSPLQYCVNLEMLDLSNNSISEIYTDWRTVHTRLQKLDLSYNKIKYVQFQDLHFSSSNILVDLSNNNISTIDLKNAEKEAINEDGFPLKHIHNTKVLLYNNPLACDCNIYDFLRYLEYKISPEVHAVVEIVASELKCASPQEMVGVIVRELRSQQLTCHWNSEEFRQQCPELCSCFLRPGDTTLIINCSRVGLNTVPAILPDLPYISNIELDLSNNFLQTLPENLTVGYSKISKLVLSQNNISALSSSLPSKIKNLEMDHNKLTHLEKQVLESLTNVSNITLHSNPWHCNCEALPLLDFLKINSEKVLLLQRVRCGGEDGSAVVQLSEKDICPTSHLGVAASVAIVMAATFIGLLVALYIRYQSHIKSRLFKRNMLL